MAEAILATLAAIFGVSSIYREYRLIVKRRKMMVSNLFLIMYGVTYGIVLSVILFLHMGSGYEMTGWYYSLDYSARGIQRLFIWFGCALVGYAVFCVGLRLRFKRKKKQNNWQLNIDIRCDDRRLQITALLCFAIGAVSMAIWVLNWGGLGNLIQNASRIRNGSYEGRNALAFFAKPAQIVTTVSLMSIMLIKNRYRLIINIPLLILSFALSFLYLLAKDGRMGMAFYFVTLFLIIANMFEYKAKISRNLRAIVVLFILFLLIVLNMDTITMWMRTGAFESNRLSAGLSESILGELKYIYCSGQTAVEIVQDKGSPLLILHDLGLALFAWVPSALTPKSLINLWEFNTSMVAPNFTAQLPADMITTALYDLGYIGILIVPFFWARMIRMLDRMFVYAKSNMNKILYYGIVMQIVRQVNYCCLFFSVAGVFHLFVALVVFWAVKKIRLA